tara:strand:+ start:855 stop:1529 length:675 start_codon:yes stop_codon:yes gene_type:complete
MKEGPRILAKYVEGLAIFNEGSNWTIQTGAGPATGWVNVGNGVFQWQGFIDISGIRTLESDMVIVPAAVQCQYGAGFFNDQTENTGGLVSLQYALTTDKIDDLDFGAAGISEPLAGFIGDNSEMEQVIYAGTEVWAPSGGSYGYTNIQKMTYGDAPPIVGPRIYVAIRMSLQRSRTSGSNTNSNFFIPPMRFMIAGQLMEVPEHQLLHLMVRQIDVQQTPDVDE